MKARLHPIAGILAMLLIATFWTSTVIAELFLSPGAIVAVKHGILFGIFLLVPAMGFAGWSGVTMVAGFPLPAPLERKKKRMPFIALNGLVVLVPSAFFLYSKAAAGEFDGMFRAVQAIELIAGAGNLVLMGLNLRDGLAFVRSRGK